VPLGTMLAVSGVQGLSSAPGSLSIGFLSSSMAVGSWLYAPDVMAQVASPR
jgi:hypothetical protein